MMQYSSMTQGSKWRLSASVVLTGGRVMRGYRPELDKVPSSPATFRESYMFKQNTVPINQELSSHDRVPSVSDP